eukprot:Skav230311  [mRNA]  locus=scaffold430:202592:204355:+ [translate_table: standard]
MQNLFLSLSVNETIFVLCGSALLLVHLLILCREAPAKCSVLCKNLKRLKEWVADVRKSDPREAFILKQMGHRKVMWAQRFLYYLPAVCAVDMTLLLYLTFAHNSFTSAEAAWLVAVVYVSSLAVYVAPWLVNCSTLDLVCLFVHAYGAFWASPFGLSSLESVFTAQLIGLALVQVPAIAIARHYAAVLLGQGMIFGAILFRLSTRMDFWRFPATKPDTILNSRALLFFNIFYLGAVVLVHHIANRLIRGSVESMMRESDSKQQLSAASGLLDLTCEAVCEIDGDLKLLSHSPKLATMLLRRSGASLEGRRLTDFIAPGDKKRAKEILMMATQSGGAAHAFHTHLVDSYSSKFRTEVFRVKYSTMDGRDCHLLGLRDFTDLKSLAGVKATDAIPDSHELVLDVHEGDLSQHGSSSRALGELASQTLELRSQTNSPVQLRSSPNLSHVTMECYDYGHIVEKHVQYVQKDAFLQIDMDRETVQAASAPFGSLIGMSIKRSFASDFTVDLLRRLCEMARELRPIDVPDQVATFDLMPIHVDNDIIQASGVMKVCLTQQGRLSVIMCIREAGKTTSQRRPLSEKKVKNPLSL